MHERENRFGKTTPILRILEEAKAREFYLGFLGFVVDWENRFGAHMPLCLQVSRSGCLLHLSEHQGDGSPGVAMRTEVEDLDRFALELGSRASEHGRPRVEEMPWGTRDMIVIDPFGNRLAFTNAIFVP